MNDVLINKIQSIQRCVLRAREEYSHEGENFIHDNSRHDADILNVTRGCEQAIDLANHIIKQEKLGIPLSSSETFELLARKFIISDELAEKLRRMVGFINIAIHQYQTLQIDIVESVIRSGLDDLISFTLKISQFAQKTDQ